MEAWLEQKRNTGRKGRWNTKAEKGPAHARRCSLLQSHAEPRHGR